MSRTDERTRELNKLRMRIRRARIRAGLSPQTGAGAVTAVYGVPTQKRGRKPKIDAALQHDGMSHGKQRRSGGVGSKRLTTVTSDGRTIRIRDMRKSPRHFDPKKVGAKRGKIKKHYLGSPREPSKPVSLDDQPMFARFKSRAETYHIGRPRKMPDPDLPDTPFEVYWYCRRDENGNKIRDERGNLFWVGDKAAPPISMCGGIWQPGRVVGEHETLSLRICKRCRASLTARDLRLQREARRTSDGQISPAAKKFVVKREMPVVLKALREKDPRGGGPQDKMLARIAPAGKTFYVPTLYGESDAFPGEVTFLSVYDYPREEHDQERGIGWMLASPVPPKTIIHDGREYRRRPLNEDSRRPIRYWLVTTVEEQKAEVDLARTELLRRWAEYRDRAVVSESLSVFLNAEQIDGQRMGHVGLGTSEDPIHYVERRGRKGSSYVYVAQYGSNRFAVLMLTDKWVGK